VRAAFRNGGAVAYRGYGRRFGTAEPWHSIARRVNAWNVRPIKNLRNRGAMTLAPPWPVPLDATPMPRLRRSDFLYKSRRAGRAEYQGLTPPGYRMPSLRDFGGLVCGAVAHRRCGRRFETVEPWHIAGTAGSPIFFISCRGPGADATWLSNAIAPRFRRRHSRSRGTSPVPPPFRNGVAVGWYVAAPPGRRTMRASESTRQIRIGLFHRMQRVDHHSLLTA
jgi:hypothetical protein